MPASGDSQIELEQLERYGSGRPTSTGLAGQSSTTREPDDEEPPPEGGQGWWVLLGCFIIYFLFTGNNYSWGIVQAHLARENVGPPSTLAFVGSLAISLMVFLGLISTVLVRRFGARPLSFIGVTLMAVGALCSSFTVDNLGGLFVTSGLIIGVGMSILFMATVALPPQYFLARRGTAMGVVNAGGALGGIVLSLSFEQLIQKLGLPWTFRIYSVFILLAGYPASWLMVERPVRQVKALVDVSLFRDYRFLLLFFGGAIGVFPLFVPAFFLPSYATTIGLSSSQGAGLLAGYNMASLVGRLSFGASSDKLGPLNCLLVTLLINAFSFIAIWPASTTVTPLVFFVVLNGAANGGFFAVMPTVVGSIFGSARIGVGMAMIVFAWTAPYLLGSPIAGYIIESYGGTDAGLGAYRPVMYYAGALSTASFCFILIVRLRANKLLRVRL